MIIITEIFRVA